MGSLREPTLGPIVGHTTDHSCRLWIRTGDPADAGATLSEDRRTIGVLTVLNKNKADPKDPHRTAYFRLHREYDRTGTFNLGVDTSLGVDDKPFLLKPDTAYQVRLGTIALDDAYPNEETVSNEALVAKLPKPEVWAEELMRLDRESSTAEFRTFPSNSSVLSFLFGSCHYPGLLWKKKHSDKIFGPMLDQAKRTRFGSKPRFVLMVGDQIYADMFNRAIPIGLADTYEEFQERYQTAFGTPNIRRLLRNLPTYMILDDHEIEDNWTQDRITERNKRVLFNIAIGAYMSYQWSHGPRQDRYDRRLFYDFDCGGFPFFVLDERTQRYKDDEPGLADNHLLGRPSFDPVKEPTQLDHLCNWLTQHKDNDRPKFIVSPTVFVPNPIETAGNENKKEKSDSWPAFPTTRRHLLQHIVRHRIQNIVFLSGDIHCSNVARIKFSGSPEVEALKAYAVTSSAFYWPFWFADGEPSNYVHDSKKQNDTFEIDKENGIEMDYIAENFTQKDNFCRVDIDWPNRKMEVRPIDKDGDDLKGKKSVMDFA